MAWRSSSRAGITAAVVGLTLVAGCSGLPGVGQGTEPSPAATGGGGTAPSQPPSSAPPEPISMQEYSAALDEAVGPLGSALGTLADAKKYKGLQGKVNAVASAADKASSGLGQLNPPAEVAAEHSKLVEALGTFGEQVSGAGSAVDQRKQCTGATVRAGIGDEKATSTLRKAMAAVSAKVPGDEPGLKLPAADQDVASRPGNGDFIRSGNRNGQGELRVENNGTADTVVSLAKKGKPLISVYVRKGKTATVRGIPDNTYAFLYTGGSGWDSEARGFGRNCTFNKFSDLAQYRTSGGQYSIYTITLKVAFGQGSPTEDVNPDDFPDT